MTKLNNQIVESVLENAVETEASEKNQKSETDFYVPHRPLICESAETTKL